MHLRTPCHNAELTIAEVTDRKNLGKMVLEIGCAYETCYNSWEPNGTLSLFETAEEQDEFYAQDANGEKLISQLNESMPNIRTIRELEALPEEQATAYWESLTLEQQTKLANAMTTAEIEAMPAEYRDSFRNYNANTLELALNELESEQTPDGKFVFTGEGDSFELTEEYCQQQLDSLSESLEGETEESLGFYGYHNLRVWIQSYILLLKEIRKEG